MKKVLLVSKGDRFGHDIQKKLESSSDFNVNMVSNSIQAIEKIKRNVHDLLILHLESFSNRNFSIVKDFRDLGYKIPILIAAPIVAMDVLDKVEKLGNANLLEIPSEDKDLIGVSNKLIAGRDVPQRIYRRYYTNQVAMIESFEDGNSSHTLMHNLSKGGAQLYFYDKVKLKKGDIVKISVNLDKVSRSHQVNGKVVWFSEETSDGATGSAGVEFISAGEVYRRLLTSV